MSSIRVRKAADADMPSVLKLVDALLRELGEEGEEAGALPVEHLTRLWRADAETHVAFLAETDDGEPVGVLTLAEAFAIYAGGRYGIINEMYVAPGYRSTGVGALLIDAAAGHGRARGWRRIDVTAPESERWERTRHFYERRGFVFTGPKLKLRLDT